MFNMKQLSSSLGLSVWLLAGALFLTACSSSREAEDTPPEVITMEYLESLGTDQLQQMDSDGDGVSDYDEMYVHNTDPLSSDSDDDGLSDSDEINVYGTDPMNTDTDDDGLNDYDEVMVHSTDPLNGDTDGDGLSDYDEINEYNTNPLNEDSDGDGLTDYDEIMTHESDPVNPDSDGDGFTDGQELEMGTNMLDPNDPVVVRELEEVNFDFDRSNLDSQARELLSENVERLETNPNYEVRVEAFTDDVGGDQYNLRLSVRRANSVANFYQENGISADRITTAGLGVDPNPCMNPNPDEKGCRENRRAASEPIHPFRYQPNFD